MSLMLQKIDLLHPEIVLFIAACVVMIVGLSRSYASRTACAWIAAAALILAGYLAYTTRLPVHAAASGLLPGLIPFAKTMIAAVALSLLLLVAGVVDRDYEHRVLRGERFDPIRSTRGEFYAFFLFSVMGLMLCASADDLIWLFLALELTSLPTYIMVAISTSRLRSQEAAVKYFFLGAFGAAMFLYGFAMLYGATGSTSLHAISQTFALAGPSNLATLGMVFAIVGVSFKIAAVPMHFYTPDVYEGAASPVAAYLAFVPKAAGFITLILLLSTIGWGAAGETGLPEPLRVVLWIMAALTMTIGNVLAVLQTSVKRILAYSSIAHTGYMLVGLIAGPGDGSLWRNGLGATLFYLLVYGATNLGAFAVLACVERRSREGSDHLELETVDDLRGLCKSQPALGWTMVLCILSLLGFPPLLGFFAKVFLFTAAISANEIILAVVMGVNSAIGAFYYLRLVSAVYFDRHEDGAPAGHVTPFGGRVLAAVASGLATVALLPFIGPLTYAGRHAVAAPGSRVVAAPAAPGPDDPVARPGPAPAATRPSGDEKR